MKYHENWSPQLPWMICFRLLQATFTLLYCYFFNLPEKHLISCIYERVYTYVYIHIYIQAFIYIYIVQSKSENLTLWTQIFLVVATVKLSG